MASAFSTTFAQKIWHMLNPPSSAQQMVFDFLELYLLTAFLSSYLNANVFLCLLTMQTAILVEQQQPTYLQLNTGTNALCMAYITQQWPDGTQCGWSGDMRRQCNQDWAYSNIIINHSGYKPDCTWLDQDHSNAIWAAAVQIHMEDFTNTTSNYSQDPNFYGSSPVLLFEYDNYQTGAGDHFWTSKRRVKQRDTPVKRIRPRSAAMGSSIISSTDPSHSAVKLCDSDTSYGPDFVSLSEGIFCDMATKTPWPFCSNSVAENCYDWDSHTLISGAGQKVKAYTNVQEWQ